MAKRPSIDNALKSRLAKKPAEQAAPAGDQFEPIPRASKQPGRGLLVRSNYAGWRDLRMLAYEQGTTLQNLGIEAFQDLQRKYNKPITVDHPDRD